MNSVIRSFIAATVLLTGGSAAMAQSYGAPATYGSAQTAAPAAASAPVAAQPAQPAPTAVAAYAAPAAGPNPKVADREDIHGGFAPNSVSGTRAFWDSRNQY
jgi:hypothetical protein